MRIGRGAGADDFEWRIAGIGDAVRSTGRDAHRIAGRYSEVAISERHDADAARDVIDLFRNTVAMQCRLRMRRNRRLGETLIAIAVHLRMHKLPYLAPVLGAVGLDRVVTVAHFVPAAANTR